ncbi:MAG: YggS family pyridoxal phosphate-dependent enzyme [Lachnospiraceae bacterium]|nr:YggS family pyridoxal phosphate-dependent enzyme [Lachnospiraceae bacterium]
MLKENLETVREQVKEACERAGRDAGKVTVLAVSKTKPNADIEELYAAGQRDFGENYVQELKEKHETLPKDIRWHMIGHLQRNKVKYIAPFVYMIHSVDSVSLADTIEKEAAKNNRSIPVLIEVNAAHEDTKFGVTPDELPALAAHIESLPHVELAGLMTSAPYTEHPEENRQYFRMLAELAVDMNLQSVNNEKGPVLSMGMSNDYIVAAEEGSTCVRVGTSIFGARDYSKS